VHNAWLATLESGIHTRDIFNETSREKVGTQEFAKAVIAHLGKNPKTLKKVDYKAPGKPGAAPARPVAHAAEARTLVGADIFIYWPDDVDALANALKPLTGELKLQTISSKGLKVWPDYSPGMNLTDQFNCRFKGGAVAPAAIAALAQAIAAKNIEFVKIENLYEYGARLGYTLGQGE
jgi:isocitrate dehydrogenase